MSYLVEQTHRDVVTLRHDGINADWSQRYLLLSDVHFDSPYCQRRMLRSYLDQAVACGAGILSFGDWFDAMQGKSDRRSDKGELMPAYKSGDYINRLVDESAEFLAPYAGNIIFLGDGNHETGIKKNLEVDILLLLAGRLNVKKMGYSGFVRFMFKRTDRGGQTRRVLYYHHGAGGGGDVTKGVMRAQRQQSQVVADIYVGGHIHEQWSVWARRIELSANGDPVMPQVLHVCLPTLKDETNLQELSHREGTSRQAYRCLLAGIHLQAQRVWAR